MDIIFPSQEWLQALIDFINADEKYAKIAKKWEGDLAFDIKADGALKEDMRVYLDLWHGTCRGGRILDDGEELNASFVLEAPYGNFVKILTGNLDPMQAMMTRKLFVRGSMTYMMRNVPTVLDFVRCAKSVTNKVMVE